MKFSNRWALGAVLACLLAAAAISSEISSETTLEIEEPTAAAGADAPSTWPPPGSAADGQEPIDWHAVALIREEGFRRSQVMDTVQHLTDRIGSRLTGSPGLAEANEWTRQRLEDWGLENAVLEPWGDFGEGWSFTRSSVHLLQPRATPLHGLPKAWTPATSGPVRGEVIRAELEDEDDLEEWRGRLAGKVVMIGEARTPDDPDSIEFHRHDDTSLERVARYPIPDDRRGSFRRRFRDRWEFSRQLNAFLVEEDVVATLDISSRNAGIVRVVAGGSRLPGESKGVPSVVLAAEHYNLLDRLTEAGETVEVELEVAARFHEDDLQGYNVLAEIPGTDKADELVMVGAHIDSWHAATGSNDNAAGTAVAMEAARILQAIGVRPRRTIRVALWTGEEQGLLGSRGYVAKHFAERPAPEDEEVAALPKFLWPETWPVDYKPAHAKFQAYFNLDNGSGKIRGIHTQSNAALVPIFERWLEPLHDLGATVVTNRNTGGTDHLAFDAYSLPGFQFVQDRLDYSTRTHHTELDHFDHAREDDLKQASVVMATFAYHAAMRDELLPRKAKPQEE